MVKQYTSTFQFIPNCRIFLAINWASMARCCHKNDQVLI